MHKQLVLALLLALLLEPAAAANPALEAAVIPAAMNSFYPDPDGILSHFCDICGAYLCTTHVKPDQLPRAPTFTAETFLCHPEWPCDSLSVFPTSSSEPEPLEAALPSTMQHDDGIPLRNSALQELNENATSMLPRTIQIHVENTYLPGDRLLAQAVPEQRRQIQRRQAPRPGGFSCKVSSCGETFNRQCELNRHKKKHLPRSVRPHPCPSCDLSFLYPKDLARHERTHGQLPSSQDFVYCRLAGCSRTDGFSRRDNLLRHQRKQHPQ